MINSLEVFLWDKKVGTLVTNKKEYKETILFYFDTEFPKNNWDIAPLRASIQSNSVKNGFPIHPDSDKIFGGLPSFIADSLPDHWGATVFREWAVNQGIRMKKLNALDRLAYIGSRGMGALEFRPPSAPQLESSFSVQIQSLYELAGKTLEAANKLRITLSPDFHIENLFKVGTSAGGKRPKAILNMNFETGECLSGQAPAPSSDFTPVIIKFDERLRLPTTRIEYSYYLLARAFEMNMMSSKLITIDGFTHFITERFDRAGSEKFHVQTLAALQPSADSYEELFEVAESLNVPKKDVIQIFMAMVMNVVFRNVDDHSKNFSFIMDKEGAWRFAPVYDFTFTLDWEAPDYVNRHSLSINGEFEDISEKDLLEVARRYDIPNPSSIIRKALGLVEKYPDFAREAGIDTSIANSLRSHFNLLSAPNPREI